MSRTPRPTGSASSAGVKRPASRPASEASSPLASSALALHCDGVGQSSRLRTRGTGAPREAVEEVAQLQVEVEDAARNWECSSSLSKVRNLTIVMELGARLHTHSRTRSRS